MACDSENRLPPLTAEDLRVQPIEELVQQVLYWRKMWVRAYTEVLGMRAQPLHPYSPVYITHIPSAPPPPPHTHAHTHTSGVHCQQGTEV